MTRGKRILVAAAALCCAALGLTGLFLASGPKQPEGYLLRVQLPTEEDVRGTVRMDEIERLESETGLIREYLRVLFDYLF